jgi:ferric-dicitrate binding protein FerR (iron transport regulator)
MSASERPIEAREEAVTARLLRLSGGRPPIAAFRESRVRATVHAHWQQQARRRSVRRRIAWAGAALGAAAALVLVAGPLRRDRSPVTTAAMVARVERLLPEGRGTTRLGENRRGLNPQDPVRTGEWIETGGESRVALRFLDGTSVRIDRGSRIRALSDHVIELSAGAVYLDTAHETSRFEVRTPVAIAHDLGTQFEIRLLDRMLRLRVRTGIVELSSRARSVAGRGGTEIAFSEAGAVSRPIPVHGAEWDWTASVSPSLEIEGVALSAFLDRVTREHGWELSYSDAALAREASGIVLHGSVRGLPPQEAIDVAMTTSGLRYRLAAGQLVVLR